MVVLEEGITPGASYSTIFSVVTYDLLCVNFYISCPVWFKAFSPIASGYRVVLAPFIEKTILFQLDCLCAFVKNQLFIYMWVYFKILYSAP